MPSRTHLYFLAYSRLSVRMQKAERGSSSSGNRLIGTKCRVNAQTVQFGPGTQVTRRAAYRET